MSAAPDVGAAPAAAGNANHGAASSRAAPPDAGVRFRYVLRLADTSLVLAQRLAEWIGHAPALEEELGLANITLDLLGQARSLLTYAGEIEGRGRSEDDLAYLRDPGEFLNYTLAEQSNRDFAAAIVRQALLDAHRLALCEGLAHSQDARLAQIAAQTLNETRYHFRYSTGWLARLADGTAESRRRVIAALDALWRFTGELCASDVTDEVMAAAGLAPSAADVSARWSALVDAAFAEATLDRPGDVPPDSREPYGRQGEHSEHLAQLLAEMQSLPRAYPGAQW